MSFDVIEELKFGEKIIELENGEEYYANSSGELLFQL
jgi:hypothetical protein